MDAWTLHQLADSALPTGGFAHSGGLEAALQLGVTTPADLAPFVQEMLWQTGWAALPWVVAAHDAPERVGSLAADHDASLPQPVANRASRVQGEAFLRALAEARPVEIAPLAVDARERRWPSHLAPVFGAALRRLGADRDETRRLFLFQAVRGVIQAAVRLGAVGAFEGQRILAAVSSDAERVLDATSRLGPEDAATTSPLLEIAQSYQPRLYSRLFQS